VVQIVTRAWFRRTGTAGAIVARGSDWLPVPPPRHSQRPHPTSSVPVCFVRLRGIDVAPVHAISNPESSSARLKPAVRYCAAYGCAASRHYSETCARSLCDTRSGSWRPGVQSGGMSESALNACGPVDLFEHPAPASTPSSGKVASGSGAAHRAGGGVADGPGDNKKGTGEGAPF
jgi:hypothetical protein